MNKPILMLSSSMMMSIPESISAYSDDVIVMSPNPIEGMNCVLTGEISESLVRHLSESQPALILTDLNVNSTYVIHVNNWDHVIKVLRSYK